MMRRPGVARPCSIFCSKRLFPRVSQYRRLASLAASSFQHEVVSGVRIATRNSPGRTTRLVVFAKAGTRYEPFPGLTAGMEEYAFKNTTKRSSLRITREAELLGSELSARHTREALMLQASFLREDLPYFMELLAEVMADTRYSTHEFHDDVERVVSHKQAQFSASPLNVALDLAHAAAFHSGLGIPIYPAPESSLSRHVDEEALDSYASSVFAKSNIAIVCDGAEPEAVGQWLEQFFDEDQEKLPDRPAISISEKSLPTVYHGGESRSNHSWGNSMVIAFPGSSFLSTKPELLVLAALLGGQPSVKWSSSSAILSKAATSTGATLSTTHLAYSDAGLLNIQIKGSANGVARAAKEVIIGLKSLAEGSSLAESLSRAIAQAKFHLLEESESREGSIFGTGLALLYGQSSPGTDDLVRAIETVTAAQVQETVRTLLKAKASISAVGDLFFLPHGEELGLNV